VVDVIVVVATGVLPDLVLMTQIDDAVRATCIELESRADYIEP
jgi:hypothetical protein